ncbi:helix-turn-helix transcriptional regulator [Streptomyces sp. WM4235]|uniref:helix-turn-helix transcriptional regulator n=1 Tax=Streptomyces sp. WM4235 TaxID=1415551 RepID=UPI0006AF84EE|nr:helix-turn-helix domain-containing protein [Streptomyces sp. WM4235]
MTEDSSASEARAAHALTAGVARVVNLAARLGRSCEDVLDPGDLHLATGVPVAVVEALLRGENAGEPDIQERFMQRLEVIRATHVRENKRKHSQAQIAKTTGISRQQINALVNGERRPTMDHCARIERFFGRPAGFLQSLDAEAVANAVLPLENALLEELARREPSVMTISFNEILAGHGVEGIAARAALLPTDQHRAKVAEWLDSFMAEPASDADGSG